MAPVESAGAEAGHELLFALPFGWAIASGLGGGIAGAVALGRDPGGAPKTGNGKDFRDLELAHDDARTAALIADVFFVVGGGAAALGLIMLPIAIALDRNKGPAAADVSVMPNGSLVVRW